MLVAPQIAARVVGTLAHDPAGAELLTARRRGRLDKSLLIRSARQVAADHRTAPSSAPRAAGSGRRTRRRQEPRP